MREERNWARAMFVSADSDTEPEYNAKCYIRKWRTIMANLDDNHRRKAELSPGWKAVSKRNVCVTRISCHLFNVCRLRIDDSRWRSTTATLLCDIVKLEVERRAMYDAAKTCNFDIDDADTRLRRPALRCYSIVQLAQLHDMAVQTNSGGWCCVLPS